MAVTVPPNADQEGGGDVTLGVSGFVIALAVVSVALRFYTRVFTKAGLKWDDWLILAAVILTLATAVLLLWGNAVNPIGIWVSDNVDPDYVYTEKDVFYLRLAFITSILYFSISSTTKLGILLMYRRIFFVSTSFRYQLYVASALVVVFWVGCTVASLTNCIPLEWSWRNGLADPRYCFDFNVFWAASGAGEVFLDALILAMPVSVVVRMIMSFRRKLTICGIFLLGTFTIITGLVKVILGYRRGFRVPSYANTEVWATVHTGMEIVCACLPVLPPLVKHIARSSFIARMSSSFSSRPPTKEDTSNSSVAGNPLNERSLSPVKYPTLSVVLLAEEGRMEQDALGEPLTLLQSCAASSHHWRRVEEELVGNTALHPDWRYGGSRP